jgi:flavin reductase (DIM6/NTAB) family NADH-FMN oxidoreductase RutF
MSAAGAPGAVDQALFRKVMGSFATGVTVILADAGGEVRGMTANAFLSASLDPPLCVVSVRNDAQMYPHLTAAQAFSVNILSSVQEDLARHFAGRPPASTLPPLQRQAGIPALADAAAQLTADIAATHPCGDHTLFVGRIRWMSASDRPPLLYHGGRFGALLPQRADDAPLLEFW